MKDFLFYYVPSYMQRKTCKASDACHLRYVVNEARPARVVRHHVGNQRTT
jgi:hypothetical protein